MQADMSGAEIGERSEIIHSMDKTSDTAKILVISTPNNLSEMIREAIGDTVEVIGVSDEKDGLEKARKELPEVIVLGYLEPPGSAFALHQKLGDGWITKNTPLLVVDTSAVDNSPGVLSMEEGLQIEADEYISLSGDSEHTSASQLAAPIARLREKLDTRLRERTNSLKQSILDPDTFCVTWEQIPGRGAFEMQQEDLIENARRAARRGRIHAVSVTDNPGGNPAISTEMLCTEIKKLGIEPLVHLAFRDKNRNQCESLLYGLAGLGVRNLLMLTGDYPASSAFRSMSRPVFDLDSVQGLQLVDMMNRGIEQELPSGKKTALAATDFFVGTAVSPFKQTEAELMGQYYKLEKKIASGAEFIITQVGYDARKLHELLTWLKVGGYNIPVIANIYVLPYGAGRLMNANGIPGCVVTDKLLAELDAERKSEDKGRSARLIRAAKMYAIAKGMGCAGVHIGGHGITYSQVEQAIDSGEEMADNWRDLVTEFDFPQDKGFYYFERSPETGLNTEKPAKRTEKPQRPLIATLARLAHVTLFDPKSPIFKMLRPVARLIDRSHRLTHAFLFCEHMAKVALFGCNNCGDCALFDVGYLCPLSQCPKNQRNGPCGGSNQGWCEVYPNERKCVWVRAYLRLKAHHEENEIRENLVPPNDWALWQTSSWLNFYLGRDHSSIRLGIKPPQGKEEGGVSP